DIFELLLVQILKIVSAGSRVIGADLTQVDQPSCGTTATTSSNSQAGTSSRFRINCTSKSISSPLKKRVIARSGAYAVPSGKKSRYWRKSNGPKRTRTPAPRAHISP